MQSPASAQARWSWPVNPDSYDQMPELSPAEMWGLAVAIDRRNRRRRRDERAMAAIDRLMRPVWDVLEVMGTNPTTVKHVECVVLREMVRRQQSYWGWTAVEWAHILSDDAAAERGSRTHPHQYRRRLLAVAYVLCGVDAQQLPSSCFKYARQIANDAFGAHHIDAACEVVAAELGRWGYQTRWLRTQLPLALSHVMLRNRSPMLTDLTTEKLQAIHNGSLPGHLRRVVVTMARALVSLGYIDRPLVPYVTGDRRPPARERAPASRCPDTWASYAARWRDTSTVAPRTRRYRYRCLLQVGRWLATTHPDVTSPTEWTRELAAEYVAAVDRATVGQWGDTAYIAREKLGQPLAANTKKHQLTAVRCFFQDCQEWGWIERRFDPQRSFRPPIGVRSCLSTNPRAIADDVWAKLLWAGLNLTPDDIPAAFWKTGDKRVPNRERLPSYPQEMVRAITLVWLFAGLRSDEIRRLRLGCIRWHRGDTRLTTTGEEVPRDAVCWLDVPVNKTGGAFTKPVDRVVGQAIAAWEAVRPAPPRAVDGKTGEVVDYLFSYRGRQIGVAYFNDRLISLLCRKAGVPASDARGNITSHRARSTIATQLFNAKEPLSLFELQEWLGHRSPQSTQYYAKITPTKLAKSFHDAGYFGRNLRMIEVLLDQEAIKSGAAAEGEPWRFYDLGHGYCAYDFFDQCPHRMACARCAFYVPKDSSKAHLLEGKASLQRLLQEIPLTDEERAAVDDGVNAYERLLERLADVPTPAGATPRQLNAGDVIPLHTISARPGTPEDQH